MATRDQLINPILRRLGWNPEDPEQVQPNVFVEEGVPDYSLFRNGKKILFVEAKKLSVDIEQRDILRQLAKYSFSEGTKYGVLTNGATWLLIRSFEEGTTLTERTIWKTDLESESLASVCRKLITISASKIEQIETLVRRSQILDEVWRSLLDTPEEIIGGLTPVMQSFIGQSYPDYQFESAEIEDFLREEITEVLMPSEEVAVDTFETAPWRGSMRKMRLKGETFEVNNSFDILVNVANWLIKNGKLKLSDCPVVVGRGKRYIVNKDPKHRSGDDFRSPKKLSNGLWIETHYSTPDCINMARRLLEKFGQSSDVMLIE